MIRKSVHKVTLFTILISACSALFPQTHGDAAERHFEFAIRNHEASENFVAITSDSTVIGLLEEQLELPEADRNLHITGPLEFGDGGHNTGRTWHFVPNEWTLAEMSVELCDGWSSGVESDLSYWLDTVGTFCPWDSHVLREIIYLGDVDDNEAIDLEDLITVMKAVAGKEADIRAPEADVNGDHQIGLAEAVYILRKLSGLD
jgi:hypothetical protein